jgi:putative ABC transport system permease protein
VSPDYFRVMRIPVIGGRPFGNADVRGSHPVVLVSRSAAALLWPEAPSPLGHHVTIGTTFGIPGASRAGGEVVGVVGDVRDAGPEHPVRPTLYLAYAQWPVEYSSIVVRATGNPSALVPSLRAALREIDPDVPMFQVRTMDQLSRDAVAKPQFYATLLTAFAGAAALLAALGLYGVLAYAVGQRMRETAVRLALGAGRRRVVGLVFADAIRLALAGLGLGLAAALVATRVLGGLLFEVSATDLPTYASVAGGLLVVAAFAAFLPARRAASVNPVDALKAE